MKDAVRVSVKLSRIIWIMMKPFFFTAIFFIVAATHGVAQTAATGSLRINLSLPLDYQVAQREDRADGKLTIAGSVVPEGKNGPLRERLQARLTGKSATGDLPGQWEDLPFDSRVSAFRGELTVPAGGWYHLELRAVWTNGEVAATAGVDHVGVGDVFVIAGQSNSANYGEKRQTNVTGMVAAFTGTNWQMAGDPEPGAGGAKGSFMPLFGDAMAGQFHVPIGIVAMGIGSTSVREWLPAGTRLSNLPPLTRNVLTVGPGQWEPAGIIFSNFTARMKSFGPHGFRAVLWHQGESDGKQANPERTLPGDLYHQDLKQLILESRQAIGWDAPWFVAQASYHNTNDVSSPDIRAAQKALWDEGIALPGPDTDTLTGLMREKRGAGIHLSDQGLHEHARLWAEKVGPWLAQQLGNSRSSP
jgi:hypothetical protein